MKKTTAFVILLLLALSTPVFAGDPGEKFGRGLTNIGLSWMEFPGQFSILAEKTNRVSALVGSAVNGTFFTIARIIGGAYEVVTFALPVPADYEPIFAPATPLEHFE